MLRLVPPHYFFLMSENQKFDEEKLVVYKLGSIEASLEALKVTLQSFVLTFEKNNTETKIRVDHLEDRTDKLEKRWFWMVGAGAGISGVFFLLKDVLSVAWPNLH